MSKLTFICDPGSNWVGDINIMKSMAHEIKQRGDNCCFKPQLYDISLYTKDNNPYYDLQEKCNMTFEQAEEIYNYCNRIDLNCIFSCFDLTRLRWIKDLGIKTVKVAARMAGDTEFLSKIQAYNMYPIITISDTYTHLTIEKYNKIFNNRVEFLYGVNKYPALIKDYDLCRAIQLKGISDHTNNIYLSLAAIIGGAKIVEKHIYYTSVNTPDILSSINLSQLKHLIEESERVIRLGEL